ncbi:MAG: hypothetical protein NTW03_08435 [Verrucomicrobia bacterium]|nr:hypothetical protein [Verrucomicrobiota bacterium]
MEAEQTQVNLQVVRAFDALHIPYFLGGSMASSVHGIYRATADADFVAAVRPHHAAPLVDLLHPQFYADLGAIQEAVVSHRSFNVIHLETMLKVDVFVAGEDPFHVMQMRRRVLQATGLDGQTSLYVASAEDTVLAKLRWYHEGGGVSERQWNDVLGVLKVQGPALDRAYLRDWALALGLTDLLRRALDDAGLPAEP